MVYRRPVSYPAASNSGRGRKLVGEMLGGLSPAGVNVGLRAVRVVEARLVVRVSGRVGEVRVARVRTVSRAADDSEAEAVDLGGTDSGICLFSKRLRTGKEPASGDDSEGREPT